MNSEAVAGWCYNHCPGNPQKLTEINVFALHITGMCKIGQPLQRKRKRKIEGFGTAG